MSGAAGWERLPAEAGLLLGLCAWCRGLPKLPWVSVWAKPTRGGARVPTARAEEL